jgi:hypothetical protein
VVAALDAVARDAQRDPAFGGNTEPAVAASPDRRTHTLTLHVPYDPTSSAATAAAIFRIMVSSPRRGADQAPAERFTATPYAVPGKPDTGPPGRRTGHVAAVEPAGTPDRTGRCQPHSA